MTATSNDEFATKLMQLVSPDEPFQPRADYDRDGDCIEFIFRPDPFYAERVDDLVTVYYSQETGEVIGSLIKGVSSFCQRMLQSNPSFRIVVQDGKVKVEHIFLAHLFGRKDVRPDDLASITYRKLIDAAEESDLEAEVGVA